MKTASTMTPDQMTPAESRPDVVTLFRPVGPSEKALLVANGFSAWPPRLPHQPFFYPVTNEEYAAQIALEWNLPERGEAYVTRFRLRRRFIERYPIQKVGGRLHTEHWIPAEDLPELNANLVGAIEIVREFRRTSEAKDAATQEDPPARLTIPVSILWLDAELPRKATHAGAEVIHFVTTVPDPEELGGSHWSVRLYPSEGSKSFETNRGRIHVLFDVRRLAPGRELDLQFGLSVRARVTVL